MECDAKDCWSIPHLKLYAHSHFPERAGPNWVDGCYEPDTGIVGIFRFRAGSYSGYNEFREHLSRMTLGVMPQTVWDAPD